MTLPTVDRADGSYRVAAGEDETVVPGEYTAIPAEAVYAPWEDAIAALFRAATDVTVGDSGFRVRIESPERALVEHDVSDDETEAVARVAVLDYEGIVAFEDEPETSGEHVVLATDPQAIDSNVAAVYNWAAVVETTSRFLDDRLERVREMEQHRDTPIPRPWADPQGWINEIHRQIQSLGDPDTDKMPDLEELSREDRRDYNILQEQFYSARARLLLTRGRTPDPTRVDPDEVLSEGIRNCEDLAVGFEQFHLEIRLSLALDTWNHGGITDLLDGLADMLVHVVLLDKLTWFLENKEFINEMDEIVEGSAAVIEPIRCLRDAHDPEERERVRRRIEARREDTDGFDSSPFDLTT